jgi:hypothetical protein
MCKVYHFLSSFIVIYNVHFSFHHDSVHCFLPPSTLSQATWHTDNFFFSKSLWVECLWWQEHLHS